MDNNSWFLQGSVADQYEIKDFDCLCILANNNVLKLVGQTEQETKRP